MSRPTATATRLDLYLAGAIARREDQHDRLRALGVDPAAARSAREAMDAGSLRDAAGGGGLDALIRAFGKPAVRRVERVAWNPALWPEHRYECQLREWGVGPGELVRATPDGPVVSAPPATLDEALAAFRPWHHTRRDLERTLGDPVYDASAYPDERCDWRLADGSEACLEFTHGLLMCVGAAPPRPEPRARPWRWAFWRRQPAQ